MTKKRGLIMKDHGLRFEVEDDYDPDAEVLRQLHGKKDELHYGEDEDDEVTYDGHYEEDEDEDAPVSSKYEQKIKELFAEDTQPKLEKVTMAKKKPAKKKKAAKKAPKKAVRKTPEKQTPRPKSEREPQPAPTTTSEPKQVEPPAPQPSAPPPQPTPAVVHTPADDEGGFFRKFVVLVIVVLLLFLAYKYTSQPAGATGATFAEQCANDYITGQGALQLSTASASDAQRAWLERLYAADNPQTASSILRMLSCNDSELTDQSDPEEYSDCPTQEAILLLTEQDVQESLGAEIAKCTKIDDMISCGNGYFIAGEDALKEGENPSKLVLLDGVKKTVTYESQNGEVVLVFKSGERYYSLAVPEESEDTSIVKLATEQGLDGLSLKYRTENPRLLAWQTE